MKKITPAEASTVTLATGTCELWFLRLKLTAVGYRNKCLLQF